MESKTSAYTVTDTGRSVFQHDMKTLIPLFLLSKVHDIPDDIDHASAFQFDLWCNWIDEPILTFPVETDVLLTHSSLAIHTFKAVESLSLSEIIEAIYPYDFFAKGMSEEPRFYNRMIEHKRHPLMSCFLRVRSRGGISLHLTSKQPVSTESEAIASVSTGPEAIAPTPQITTASKPVIGKS